MIEENNVVLPSTQFSEGLRAYMLRVYNYMMAGLLVSASFAWIGTEDAVLRLMFKTTSNGTLAYSAIGWIVLLAPFVFVFLIHSSARNLNPMKAQIFFWIFSALNGLALSPFFFAFSKSSITTAFLITAAMFAALSLYGYTTQRDLTSIGQFAFVGLIGVIIAALINLFLGNGFLDFALSIICVVIFTILIAYDTQKIRRIYQLSSSDRAVRTLSIIGALELYLDFINLFLNILRLLNSRQK